MTLYGYARVSVREPEDKNLDLQVERLVRAGCAMGNIRAKEASRAKNERGGVSRVNYFCRLAQIILAGSPPYPDPAVEPHLSGSWGRLTPG